MRHFFEAYPFSVEMAEGPGFEPGLTGPEPVVLPLDDPSANIEAISKMPFGPISALGPRFKSSKYFSMSAG